MEQDAEKFSQLLKCVRPEAFVNQDVEVSVSNQVEQELQEKTGLSQQEVQDLLTLDSETLEQIDTIDRVN